MPECYIRGSTIKYLRIPDEVIDMVKEPDPSGKQRRDMRRGPPPTRGGRGRGAPGARGGGGSARGGGHGHDGSKGTKRKTED